MKVSIIIPTYNSHNTVGRAIDSALKQNFPRKDFEVLVINDGSTDNTSEILKIYGNKIRVINQKNKGAVNAANNGFRAANGEYVIKLDADDYFEQNILKEMAKILDNKPKIDFAYCDYYEKPIDGNLKITSTSNLFNTIAGGIMFKKNKFSKEGFYNEKIKFAEYDLLLKTQNRWKGYHIASPLYYYNRRPESLTGSKQWVREAINQLKKFHPKKIKEIKKVRKY